jgi:hypothetical protein
LVLHKHRTDVATGIEIPGNETGAGIVAAVASVRGSGLWTSEDPHERVMWIREAPLPGEKALVVRKMGGGRSVS